MGQNGVPESASSPPVGADELAMISRFVRSFEEARLAVYAEAALSRFEACGLKDEDVVPSLCEAPLWGALRAQARIYRVLSPLATGAVPRLSVAECATGADESFLRMRGLVQSWDEVLKNPVLEQDLRCSLPEMVDLGRAYLAELIRLRKGFLCDLVALEAPPRDRSVAIARCRLAEAKLFEASTHVFHERAAVETFRILTHVTLLIDAEKLLCELSRKEAPSAVVSATVLGELRILIRTLERVLNDHARVRAAALYDALYVLVAPLPPALLAEPEDDLSRWVREAASELRKQLVAGRWRKAVPSELHLDPLTESVV